MREWINLLEAAQWHDTVVVNKLPVDLYKNPTRNDWLRLFKEFSDGLRGHILVSGDLVVWDAWHATHGDMERLIEPILPGYRYFYPDHIMFNDLNWNLNDINQVNSLGEHCRYDSGVRKTYTSTVTNPSIIRFYGPTPSIIGIDDEASPSKFPVTKEWVDKNCGEPN
jgi:hypothetical protein